jgi:hypothetical protein
MNNDRIDDQQLRGTATCDMRLGMQTNLALGIACLAGMSGFMDQQCRLGEQQQQNQDSAQHSHIIVSPPAHRCLSGSINLY